jgi:hypothetical protein
MKRGKEQKALDYMLFYSAGPQKMDVFSSQDLQSARARYTAVNVDMASLEAALHNRADEEGCSAVLAAITYPNEGKKG